MKRSAAEAAIIEHYQEVTERLVDSSPEALHPVVAIHLASLAAIRSPGSTTAYRHIVDMHEMSLSEVVRCSLRGTYS